MTRKRIELHGKKDVKLASASGESLARRLGLDQTKKACLALAIREVTQAALRSSTKMACIICDESDDESIRVRVAIANDGPGILISTRRSDGHANGNGQLNGRGHA